MSDLHRDTSLSPAAVPAAVPASGPVAVPRSVARRLRIAVVAESFPQPDSGPGSAGTGALLEHLHRRGHDTLLVCPVPRTGKLPTGVAGAPVVSVPSMSLRGHPLGLPSRAVMRALAAFAPDVVHLAAPLVVGAAALGAAAQLGVPTVAGRETGQSPQGLLGRSLARRALAADLTLEIGPELFSPRRGTDAGRLRRQWAPDGALVVGYWGAEPVEVAGTVATRLGDGTPTGTVSGWDADLAGVLAALDLLVVGNASPLIVERALASGVPVIAPDGPGGQELVRPGMDGLVHRTGDRNDLARCVHALASDAHRRHWAGMAAASGAQRRARERFGDELISRYREVIAQAGGSGDFPVAG